MDSAFSEEKLVDWTQGVSRLKESAFQRTASQEGSLVDWVNRVVD